MAGDALAYLFQGLAQGAQPIIQMLPYLLAQKREQEERRAEREADRAERRSNRAEDMDIERQKLDIFKKRSNLDAELAMENARQSRETHGMQLSKFRAEQADHERLVKERAEALSIFPTYQRALLEKEGAFADVEGKKTQTAAAKQGMKFAEAQQNDWLTNKPNRDRATQLGLDLQQLQIEREQRAKERAPFDEAANEISVITDLLEKSGMDVSGARTREFIQQVGGGIIQLRNTLPHLITAGQSPEKAKAIVDDMIRDYRTTTMGMAKVLGISEDDLASVDTGRPSEGMQKLHNLRLDLLHSMLSTDPKKRGELKATKDAVLRALADNLTKSESKPTGQGTPVRGGGLNDLFAPTPGAAAQLDDEAMAASRLGVPYTNAGDLLSNKDGKVRDAFKKEMHGEGVVYAPAPGGKWYRLPDSTGSKEDQINDYHFKEWAYQNPNDARESLTDYARARGVGIDEKTVADWKDYVIKRLGVGQPINAASQFKGQNFKNERVPGEPLPSTYIPERPRQQQGKG